MIPDPRSVRAVAFDLDDTLLRDDRSISDETVETLRILRDCGLQILPVSGRTRMSMKPFVDRLGCVSLFIACNGAEIWDQERNVLLRQETFSAELGREIARFGNDRGCYMQTYAGDGFFYNRDCDWSEGYASSSSLKGVCVGNLAEFIREPRSKILMMDSPEKIAVMLQEAREQFQGRLTVTCSKPYFLELNALRATKGIALAWISAKLGFTPENVMAFGDSLNDLSMLESAGWSVVVANGREELKTVCTSVCPSNQEDGVARFLRETFRGVYF